MYRMVHVELLSFTYCWVIPNQVLLYWGHIILQITGFHIPVCTYQVFLFVHLSRWQISFWMNSWQIEWNNCLVQFDSLGWNSGSPPRDPLWVFVKELEETACQSIHCDLLGLHYLVEILQTIKFFVWEQIDQKHPILSSKYQVEYWNWKQFPYSFNTRENKWGYFPSDGSK